MPFRVKSSSSDEIDDELNSLESAIKEHLKGKMINKSNPWIMWVLWSHAKTSKHKPIEHFNLVHFVEINLNYKSEEHITMWLDKKYFIKLYRNKIKQHHKTVTQITSQLETYHNKYVLPALMHQNCLNQKIF